MTCCIVLVRLLYVQGRTGKQSQWLMQKRLSPRAVSALFNKRCDSNGLTSSRSADYLRHIAFSVIQVALVFALQCNPAIQLLLGLSRLYCIVHCSLLSLHDLSCPSSQLTLHWILWWLLCIVHKSIAEMCCLVCALVTCTSVVMHSRWLIDQLWRMRSYLSFG